MTWWAFTINRTSLPVEQSLLRCLLTHCALQGSAARQEGNAWRLFSLFFYGLIWMCANNYLLSPAFPGIVGYPSGLAYILKDTFKYNQGWLSPEQSRAGMIDRGIKEGLLQHVSVGAECWLASTGHGLCGGDSWVGSVLPAEARARVWAVLALQEMRKRCVWRGTWSCLLWQPRVSCKSQESASDGKWFLNSCPGGRALTSISWPLSSEGASAALLSPPLSWCSLDGSETHVSKMRKRRRVRVRKERS